ncbi:MAG: YbaB/EbfC family nucleoid-associated protein [Anaerolineae bacterium]|nr:YbaB/EbfC family nucleoid-associated protein [Anaerolineae bacterium]
MAKGKRFARRPARIPRPGDIAQQVQKLQEEMRRAQEALEEETVEVSVGGGAVTVVMTGQQKLRSVAISPDVIDPDDVEMLQDLILAAVNEALERSQGLAADRLSALTGGLGIPGLM